jgi:uncharacterized Ntn-hydrolase superfamily protein
MMSAALVVVDGQSRDAQRPGDWTRPLVDLRVDRADDPLRELRRLVDASEAFDCFYRASVALWLRGDPEDVLREANDALAVLPGEPILRFARAQALLALGDVEHGRAELRSLIASRPTWETVVRSYAAKGRLRTPEPYSIDELLQ